MMLFMFLHGRTFLGWSSLNLIPGDLCFPTPWAAIPVELAFGFVVCGTAHAHNMERRFATLLHVNSCIHLSIYNAQHRFAVLWSGHEWRLWTSQFSTFLSTTTFCLNIIIQNSHCVACSFQGCKSRHPVWIFVRYSDTRNVSTQTSAPQKANC